jgi:hypothetical protein
MRRALIVCAVGALLAPTPASAGGWWSFLDVDRSTVAVGQRVSVREYVTYDAVPEGDGPFYVYLLRGLDSGFFARAIAHPGRWSLGDAQVVRVGRVDMRYAPLARAAFTVPRLPPGRYDVGFCTPGCRRPLGDTMPGRLTVAADPATADLAERVDRLEARVDQQRAALYKTDVAQERLRDRAQTLRLELRSREPQAATPRHVWLLVGALGALAASALAALALRVLRAGNAAAPEVPTRGWRRTPLRAPPGGAGSSARPRSPRRSETRRSRVDRS